MKPIPVLNGSEYRERATMKRHVKENKAGMNSGTWNTAQGKKSLQADPEAEDGFKRSTSVIGPADPHWSCEQVTGTILPYLNSSSSLIGHIQRSKHTPLHFFFK